MRRLYKKIGLLVCAAVLLICSLFGVACATKFDFSLTTRERPYRVGDSVNCYDFVEWADDVEYTFAVTNTAGEKTTVRGKTYYVDVAGTYTLECTAKKGNQEKVKTTTFQVLEVEPFMMHYGTVYIPLASRLRDSMLINRMAPVIVSDTTAEKYFTSVVVYKDFGTVGETFTFGENETHRYFNGRQHLFVDEGKYVYTLVVENEGGKVEKQIPVEVREDYEAMQILKDATASYDKTTKTVTWDAVEGASYYKVKIDQKMVVVDGTSERSLDISPYFAEEFQYFQLQIAAIDATETRLGRIMSDYVIVSPLGFENVVLSSRTEVDSASRTATLATDKSWGRAPTLLDDKNGFVREYIGFSGEYGVGTYLDFEFKGNNMPTVRFFANDIDNYLTQALDKTNNGLIFIPGFDSYGSGVHAPHISDFRVYGPNALDYGYLDSTAAKIRARYFYDTHPLMTMKGRMENPTLEMKYTVGTYLDSRDNTIVAHTILYKKVDGAWVETYNLATDTNILATEVTAGNIVVLGPMVEESATFTFSQPYEGNYVKEPAENMCSYGAKYLSDNSVSLASEPISARYIGELDTNEHSFIAFKGEYGVGTFIDFTFKGNNMPNVRLFANELTGYISNCAGSKTEGSLGLLFSNGIETKNGISHTGAYYIAPKMITARYDLANNFNAYTVGGLMPYLTQNKLAEDPNAEYKYTVGTIEDTDGTVVAIVYLYQKQANEWVVMESLAWDTDESVAVWEARGGNIVVMCTIKSETQTVFTFTQPYTKAATASDLVGNRAKWDSEGNVTLVSHSIKNSVPAAIDAKETQKSYISYSGQYGVGTYLDFEFTGNNMPQVRFFANSIDGLITKFNDGEGDTPLYTPEGEIQKDADGNPVTEGSTWWYSSQTSGLLFTNGCVNGQHSVSHGQNGYLRVYYDMMSNGWLGWPPSDPNGGYVFEKPENTFMPSLGMAAFAEKADTKFRYTVGTYEDTDGTTIIHVIVKAEIDGVWTLVSEQKHDTGKLATEFGSGSIVVLAAMKGGGETTTFKCSGPYTK